MRRAIFFDFDGTLAHTAPDMVAALHRWQAENNQPPIAPARAQAAVSGGARALLALTGTHETDAHYPAAKSRFLSLYEASGYANTALFTGMRQTLCAITAADWKWGVATNKPRQYFAPIAEKLSLPTPALVAGDDCAHAKPAPDMLLHAAALTDAEPRYCCYVGDDVRDSLAAKAAGMRFILAGWGYWPASDWQQAESCGGIAATPLDVLSLARGLISA